jgi:uncharacterized protein
MKINNRIINEVKEKAKKFFIGASGCHDWTHTERVYNLAVRIGKKEKADIGVVKLSAYLHDIGRKEEMESKGKICHAERGVELAEKILSSYDLDKEIVENIKHCVLSHRYRNNYIPSTIEAKVLFDADKLDSIGAIGIGRDFLFAGYLRNPLYVGNEKKLVESGKNYSYSKGDTALLEYYFKLKRVLPKISTKTGKQIAKARHDYMVDFFKRFEKEVKGVL